MKRHSVKLLLLLLYVILLYKHEDHGAAPQQHADPPTSHTGFYQAISKDSLVARIIGEKILLVPVAKVVGVSINMVVMKLLVNNRISEDSPETRQ